MSAMSCSCTTQCCFPEDVALFAELVRMRDLAEKVKPANYSKIAGRVVLFHEVMALGLKLLHEKETERGKSRGI